MPNNRCTGFIYLAIASQYTGAGTNYLVQTPAGVLYCVFADISQDVSFSKSLDGGRSWSLPTTVFTGTVTALSVWYDRWSNISAGLIHCAYTESVTDDTLYRTINTESSDALSTQTSIFAGTSTGTNSALSICRARGGNVYCSTSIDDGTEAGFFRLPNANVPNGAWDAARTTCFEGAAANDMIILVPGFAADNQDMMAFFWDVSNNEISRKLYDDSANSWAESSIATGMTETAAGTNFPNFAAAVDLTNSQNLLVAWSQVDAANADLRCWTVTESAITETSTNVVLNSTDDQGLCGICIELSTGHWHVFYGGKSDGSQTFTTVTLQRKISKDAGATWGAEEEITGQTRSTPWLATVPRCTGDPPVAFLQTNGSNMILCNIGVRQPRAALQLGV